MVYVLIHTAITKASSSILYLPLTNLTCLPSNEEGAVNLKQTTTVPATLQAKANAFNKDAANKPIGENKVLRHRPGRRVRCQMPARDL